METNLSSWLHHQLSHRQSSYLNSLSHPLNLGAVNSNPPWMNPCAGVTSQNRTLTEIAPSGISYPKQWQPNESHAWLHGFPRCHQAINDVANTLSPEETPNFSRNEKVNSHNEKANTAQKRFLVFDQSGDETTLFISPGISPPVQVQLPSPGPKLNYDYYEKFKMVQTEKSQHQEPIMTYKYHEKLSDDVESEMREDTEEINALLYSSDDEYYYEDEEEASTGHSPSTMTEFDHEQVGSNFGPNKRIKLSKVDTKRDSECEDDAESSGVEKNQDFGERKMMKDRIREKVSLIQSITPIEKGKGNNVVLILDEAIDYLKLMKVKAQALGVHTN